MGLGAFMGMFVGTTVTVVHTAVNRGPFTGLAKRSGAMGASSRQSSLWALWSGIGPPTTRPVMATNLGWATIQNGLGLVTNSPTVRAVFQRAKGEGVHQDTEEALKLGNPRRV
eukprot:CAMPEP_0205829598 /NCGR_PEP_ID=MMETSP0206-20130828/38635_1 /ASSEMBLY_ACC=CAM_ASM_000279 /TAXON_ID=36767 /ORGANISM="Euplotes focardii, Strain TN1" /LENGTH=112 /DNA_ID=CAMNT_0053132457 /DNA_START=123 /DNA_END=462 /DNA_ORIENTATION=+